MLYEHYKGGLYRVLAEVARHTETGEDVVVYMSVETGLVWVRPSELFYGYLTTNEGKVIKRFKAIIELKKHRENADKIGDKKGEF
ncbi:DUF1653 domain-containing protein [Bacillus cereus]|uniref:DUF1653 domain-containing protein n=1 Tax=Bacillus cereus TaxID=1396 RepID=UPI001F08EC35